MNQVWKSEVSLGRNNIFLPTGSRILSFGVQDLSLVVWALVDTSLRQTSEHHIVEVHFTCSKLPAYIGDLKFLNTAQDGMQTYHAWTGTTDDAA